MPQMNTLQDARIWYAETSHFFLSHYSNSFPMYFSAELGTIAGEIQ